MEFILSIWRIGLGWRLFRYAFEIRAFHYLYARAWWGGWHTRLELYRLDRGGIRFNIQLPLVSIANDVMQQAEPAGENSWKVVPVISGQIFKRKFGRIDEEHGR